jgi:O-antigen ligase
MRTLFVIAALLCAGISSAALVVSPAAAALPLGLLLLCVWFYSPSAGLVTAVAVFPFQRSLLGMPAYVLSSAPVALTALSVAARRGIGNVIPSFRQNAPQYLACAMFAYTVLSLLVRASLQQGGTLLPNVMATEGPTFYKYTTHALLVFLLSASLVRSIRLLRRLTWVVLASLGCLSLVGLHHALTGDNELLRTYWGAQNSLSLIQPRFDAVTSIFFDSNRFGNYLVSAIFVCLPLVYGTAERRLAKGLAAAVLALAVTCLYLTFSVANWLGFVVACAVWLLWWGRKKMLLAAGAVVLAAMFLAGNLGTPSVDFLPPALYDKIDALARLDFGPDSPLHIRADLVRAGLEIFRTSPAFGAGYGGYQPWISKSSHYMELTRHIVYSHNSYVLVLAELGIVGIGLLVAFLAACIGRASSNIARAPNRDLKARQIGLLAAIAANLVFLTSYDSILYSLNLWIPLGLTVALTGIVEAERLRSNRGQSEPGFP